ERMPVAHRNHHARVEIGAQHGLERRRLAPGVFQNRTAPADLGIVMLHVARPRRGNQFRQRLARDSREWEIDNVGVAKQVIKERFDTLQRVRAAQLEQHYPEFGNISQSGEFTLFSMGTRLAAGFLALASLAVPAQTPPAAATPCAGTASYQTCELVFELSDADAAKYPNPAGSVDLSINFRSHRARGYTVPGLWDGGRPFARFTPVEAGEWAYLVNSNVGELQGKQALFTTNPSESKGFIR